MPNIITTDSQDGFKKPSVDEEEGSPFGWFDRMTLGWRDGMVFDYSDWEARDLTEMLKKDYKARQLDNVLTLPILSAEHNIVKGKHGKKEYEFLKNFWKADHHVGGCKTTLNEIVAGMTSAIPYKKAYFEKVWTEGTGDFDGKIVYDKLAWRPQTTCRVMRDPKHGGFRGFEQEAYYVGDEITKGHWPIQIPPKRAFVYIHGIRQDPLMGCSDMEISYWCWKTKQKILFLWFQFLEGVSLPRVIVTANDTGTANQIASQVAKLKSSGIIPIATPSGSDSVGIKSLDISGKGADQFMQAITWLDNAATNAVLAGFLNLTNGQAQNGSYALSKDSSDFFLQMEEAKAREIENAIRKDLFGPLVRYNFGPDAVVPHFKFEPLNDIDKSTSVSLLQGLLNRLPPPAPAAPGQPAQPGLIPDAFIGDIATQVAGYIGLDPKKVEDDFKLAAAKAKAIAKKTSAQMASPQGQAVAGVAGATQQAGNVVSAAADPAKVAQVRKMFGG